MQHAQGSTTVGGGRYRLESRIGIGGQAAVYKAFDERLQVWRAIKVLMPEYAHRAPLRARFESEAQAMANLDHPNIVRVFDVMPDAELPFIIMELVPGGSLAHWVEQHGAMPPRLAVRCVLQTAAAVGAKWPGPMTPTTTVNAAKLTVDCTARDAQIPADRWRACRAVPSVMEARAASAAATADALTRPVDRPPLTAIATPDMPTNTPMIVWASRCRWPRQVSNGWAETTIASSAGLIPRASERKKNPW